MRHVAARFARSCLRLLIGQRTQDRTLVRITMARTGFDQLFQAFANAPELGDARIDTLKSLLRALPHSFHTAMAIGR